MTPRLIAALVSCTVLAASAGAAPERTARDCIDLDRVVTRHVLDPRMLEFDLVGGVTVRSRLADACPRLQEIDRTHTLSFDNRNGRRICAGDRFKVVDLVIAGAGGTASFAWCRFGAFERQPTKP